MYETGNLQSVLCDKLKDWSGKEGGREGVQEEGDITENHGKKLIKAFENTSFIFLYVIVFKVELATIL